MIRLLLHHLSFQISTIVIILLICLLSHLQAGKVAELKGIKHSLGVGVDLNNVTIKSGSLGDEVESSLSLLLLELQRDASDGALLDALHQVSNETGDSVSHSLGGNDSHLLSHTLVGVEVEGEARVVLLDDDTGGLLDGLGADSLQ